MPRFERQHLAGNLYQMFCYKRSLFPLWKCAFRLYLITTLLSLTLSSLQSCSFQLSSLFSALQAASVPLLTALAHLDAAAQHGKRELLEMSRLYGLNTALLSQTLRNILPPRMPTRSFKVQYYCLFTDNSNH